MPTEEELQQELRTVTRQRDEARREAHKQHELAERAFDLADEMGRVLCLGYEAGASQKLRELAMALGRNELGERVRDYTTTAPAEPSEPQSAATPLASEKKAWRGDVCWNCEHFRNSHPANGWCQERDCACAGFVDVPERTEQ